MASIRSRRLRWRPPILAARTIHVPLSLRNTATGSTATATIVLIQPETQPLLVIQHQILFGLNTVQQCRFVRMQSSGPDDLRIQPTGSIVAGSDIMAILLGTFGAMQIHVAVVAVVGAVADDFRERKSTATCITGRGTETLGWLCVFFYILILWDLPAFASTIVKVGLMAFESPINSINQMISCIENTNQL